MKRLIALLLLLAAPAFAQSAPVLTSITAVHIDARQRQVPTATAPTITLPKATDATISLIVRNSDNTRLNIASAAITLTVRKAITDASATISRLATITDAVNGVATFDLAQSDTSDLALGDYVYSIEAVWSGGAREQLVKVSPLKLVATVGQPSDTPTTPTPEAVVGYGLPVPSVGDVNKYLKLTGVGPTTLAWTTVSGGGGGGSVTINTTSPLSGGATGDTFTLSCPTCVVTSGSYSNPAWLTALAASKISGSVAVANGGTGLTSAGSTANRALYTADGSAFTVGQLPNAALANSSVTVNTTGPIGGGGAVSLGGSLTLTCTTCLTSADTGVNVQAYDADLGALAALSTTGVLVRTGAGTATTRTITASSPLSLSNGDGVSGAPALSCPTCVATGSSYSDPSWLTSLAASKLSGQVPPANGGLGTTAPTADGQLPIASAGGSVTWARLTAGSNVTITNAAGGITIASSGGASGYATVAGAGTPVTQRSTLNFGSEFGVADNSGATRTDVTIASGGVTNTMLAGSIANAKLANSSVTVSTSSPLGGGGSLSLGGSLTLTCSTCLTASPTTTGDMFYSTSGGQALSRLAAVALGYVLASGGVGTAPQWLQPGGDVTGAIGALTVGKIQGKAVGSTSPTDGMLLIGRTSDSSWVPATLTAGSNVTITNAGGAITIASSGGASGYATIQNAGSGLTQRATLNCSTGLTCADNAGQSRTDVSLTNTNLTVNGTSISLGGSGTVTANTTNAHTAGTGLSGSSFDGSAARTWTVDQAFSPTWTGTHTFANASSLRVNNSADTFYSRLVSGATANRTATIPDATGTLAMLSLAQTWSAVQTHNNAGRIRVNNSADSFYGELTSAATANRTLTLPDATDTLVGLAATQTLTNKTISGASNTLSAIGNSSLTNSSVTVTASTGLSGGGSVSLGGSTSLSVSYGTTSGTATQGNDTRLPPAPSSAGRVLYDNASAWTALAAGTSTQVLHGGTAPSWGSVSLTADVSGTLPIGNGGTNITTYTVGDILYASGSTTLSKLADVAAGSFLRSGGTSTAPAWSTLVLPNAATSGDLLYASSSNTIGALGIGLGGRLLAANDAGTAPVYGHAITKSATINSGTTGAGNVDTTVLSIPAGATSSTNSFLVTGVLVRVLQAMVGGGGITFTCGATAGGTEFLASQSITSATGVGTTYGLTAAQAGSSFTSGNQYNALVNGSTSVICRSALTGTVSTQAIFQVTVMGIEL